MNTKKLLKLNNACKEGIIYFKENYGKDISPTNLLICELEVQSEYVRWILVNLGKYIKPSKTIRKLLYNDMYKYLYCRYIENNKKLANQITDRYYLYLYCLNIENDKGIANKITNSYYVYHYCKYMK